MTKELISTKKKDGDNCLHIAARNGHLYLCQILIDDHGFEENNVDNNGCTALLNSAQSGNYELVKYFVDKGTDIHQKTKNGEICLHIAARSGHLHLCQTLIDDHGFDENCADNKGWTAFLNSAQSGNYELVKYFVDKGTDIHQKTKNGENCLHIAARSGHLYLCQTLINDHGFDKNIVNNNGWPALHRSAESGNYELFRYFVDKGADIHQKTNDGDNCLHIAARNGHLYLCQTLIDDHGFDENIVNKNGQAALHHSAQSGNYELIRYFVDKGADIHQKTKDGDNCLHIAARNGQLYLCQTLIDDHGFDKSIVDNNGWTAVHCSAQGGNYELFRYFVDKGTDVHQKTKDGDNCLHIAAREGHLNLCQTLIDDHDFDKNIVNNNGWTALHCSAGSGNYELVRYFVDKGADIHQKTKDGDNCLHIVALKGHLYLCQTLIGNHGFDKSIVDNNGWTAVHCSAESGNYELFRYFVDKGTDVHQKTKDGDNCLHIAAREGHLNLCQTLIDDHDFDKNIVNNNGWTALHCSAGSGNYELVRYFVDKGADIHQKTKDGDNCLHIAALKGYLYLCQTLIDDHGFDENCAGNMGWTALLNSAQSGNYELVRYFVDKGADIHQKRKDGDNCLHIAARNGHLYLCQTLIDDHGFDENIVDNKGWAAFHDSAQSGNYELFRYFVDKGTDVHQKTEDGDNCLHIAAREGHLYLCQTLIDDHGFDESCADDMGGTALLNSAQSGSYELVKYFVDKGIDIHQKTKNGENCLHIAARNGHLYLCQTLIDDHGFDESCADDMGWTALLNSAQSGSYELVKYFVDKGIDIHQKRKNGENCLHIAALKGHLYLCQTLIGNHGFDKSIVDNNGWTAVHCSAQGGNYELVKYFVDKGTDVHQKTKDGDNCLHIAAREGHLNLCQTLIDDHGFDESCADDMGGTALLNSDQSGSYELVKYFVDKGIDIHQKRKNGENCLHIAARNGHLYLC